MAAAVDVTREVMSLLLRALIPSTPPPRDYTVGRHQPSSRRRSSIPEASYRYKFRNRVSLKASSSLSDSPPSIFLPFLEEDEEEEVMLVPEKAIEDELQEEVDPIVEFFKSRASITRDSAFESKLKLNKNRRTSWHLEIEKEEEPEAALMDTDCNDLTTAETGDVKLEVEGVVERILRTARSLPENTTLGEVLGPFEGQVSEKQCWEVLHLMGTQGLMVSCLYFFEWMGLQEPSLVTPRACTVLFPLLGRAGMGDKLMILFRNLPNTKRLRDVHVYNAAISGLLCCGR